VSAVRGPGDRAGGRRPAVIGWAAVAAVGVGLIALALCLWRVMPSFGFWDTAEFQTVLPVMGTAHPTGYPTYVLIGWLASVLLTPLGEPAFRVNVLSAILVAIGAGVTVDLARRLTGSLVLGVATGLGVALTPIVWAIGTHADPHALHFTLVAIIVWLLVRWEHARRGSPTDAETRPEPRDRADRWLVAAAVVTGISTGNHSLTLLLGPPIILYVLAVAPGTIRRPRLIATCLAAAAIPAVLVRFEMILRAGWFEAPFVYADPSTWSGFWYVTSGQQFHSWLTDPLGDWPRRIADLTKLAGLELGPLAPLVIVGLAVTAVRQPRYALFSGTAAFLTCFFNSVYPDGAIDRYYLGPALFAWTWLAILAAAFVESLVGNVGRSWAEAPDDAGGPLPSPAAAARDSAPVGSAEGPGALDRLLSSGLLRTAGIVVVAAVLLAPSFLALPQRARTLDRTDDHSAQTWTDAVLGGLEPNAVVVSWWSYSTPLWYATIVDGRRPDIAIIDDRTRLDCNLGELDHVIALYLPTRPVYLIRNGDSELPQLAKSYQIIPDAVPGASNVLRVLPLDGATAPAAGNPAPCRFIYP
jgi:transmembrane protein TMEM260 (protein O-mannosyltransferase)